jgi:hypothetical protein
MVNNQLKNIPDPTPNISKKFSKFRNISKWVGQTSKLNPNQIEEYMETMFTQNTYENLPKNVGFDYELEEEEPYIDEDTSENEEE